ncbi:unnamed protein product [Brachionus calyciflorus]|uniref:Myb-like domain-containing protein n=1 Tax=Brachionus calyciflorus TaxID=104777 RepID=A0A813ZIR9_9BILA|nr:unnamed protein product [Brachionus calyciflorus]
MSEETSSSQSNKTPGPVRFRSRFPKAQPNLAVSTGLARIRKISGHFDTTTPTTPNENHSESTLPPSPAPIQTTRQLIDSVLSPKPIQNEDDISKSPVKQPENPPPQSPNLTFRQLINQTSSQPGTPIPNGTVPVAAFLNNTQAYNPQFTKEHIMNIIKLKAMQKLKKIESENLKEKRKKNKKNSILFKKVDNEGQAGSSLVNNNETIIDKSKLRMRDFLYYNPKSTKKNEEVILADDSCSRSSYNEQILGRINRSSSSISLVNSEADTNESISSKASSISSSLKLPMRSVALAPQLRINDDGSIVINEESLVIQREEPEPVYESTVVESEHGDNLNYNSYRKFHHTKKWSEKETAKFYKALSMVGTDFTMIQKFFQHRNRDEIKRKFKREEKINQALIDKILSKTIQIDLSFFVSSSSGDDEENNKNADDKATNATNKKVKKNKKNESKDETLSSKKDDKDTKKKEKLKRIQKSMLIFIYLFLLK